MPIGPRGDEVRTTGLRAGGNIYPQRQDRQKDSCRNRDRSLVGGGPCHCTEFLGIDRFRLGRTSQRSDRDRQPSEFRINYT